MRPTWVQGVIGFAVSALLAAGVMAGCGGDDDANDEEATPAAQATACDLAPPEDVEAILGQPLEGEGTAGPDVTCHYVIDPDSLILRITVDGPGGTEELENLRTFEDSEDISGLGDGAVFTEIAGFPVVSALTDDTLVGVSVPDELGRDGAEQIVQLLIERVAQGE